MHIRKATPDDNEPLQQVMARCPQGTSLVLTLLNSPDFFARAKAYETHEVFVAQDGDTLIGSAACALREVLVNDTLHQVGYEFQYFTAPAYRRQGVGARLHQHIEAHLVKQGAAWSSLCVVPGNIPSIRLFESQGFRLHRSLRVPIILVHREMPPPRQDKELQAGHIRAAGERDLDAVAGLMNATWAGYNLYAPASAASLRRFVERTPAYRLDQLLLLEEQGELVACAGIWDWSQIIQITVNALSPSLKLTGWALSLARLFLPMPRIPQPGDTLKQWGLTPLGYKTPAHLAVLLREINNRALRSGVEQIMTAAGEPGDALLQSVRPFVTTHTDIQLYLKPLLPQQSIDGRAVFMDMIDF